SDLNRRFRPTIVFLSETKNNSECLSQLKHSLDFGGSYFVDPIALSGGLALFWINNINISVLYSCKFYIHT
ncbi:hypothetical protein LINPERPRIM_LOCUS21646, partial [Linum perenne]